MTPLEVLATIFGVLVLLKLLLIIFNPPLRIRIVESILNKNIAVLTIIYLVLTAIVGYYVLSSLSIVEVAAAMMLLSGLMGLFFIQYPKIMLQLANETLSSDFLKKNWLSILIWAAIAVWVLFEVFG